MDVERGDGIHGIPASALKAMLTKRHGRFTTPEVMADLGLLEPAATDAMLGLARDGYVAFVGRPNAVDVWEAGATGRRLMATRIGKRFPAREGRRVAEAVVAAAREANADLGIAVRVTWLALFGSVLEADDDALVGDVDLIVRIQRRRLPKDELTRLEEAQAMAEPPSRRGGYGPFLSAVALSRRLGRVSAKASLMDASTLDLGIRHRVLYAYDVGREAEIPVSGRTRTSKARPDDVRRAAAVEPIPEILGAPPWPPRPGPRLPNVGGPDRLAHGDGLVAQHMWRRGLALDEIAVYLAVPARALQAYLAAQATRPEGPLVVAASLAATLAANVPGGAAIVRAARADVGRGKDSGVWVTLSYEGATCAGTMTGALSLIEGEMSLAPLVERACAAAERWRQWASKALRGVPATCQLGPGPRGGGEFDRGVPDLSSLKAACEGWLRRAGPVKASFGTHGRSMSVEVGGPDGARVESPWGDRDPTEDAALMAEAARLDREAGPTGVAWTFRFADDGEAES